MGLLLALLFLFCTDLSKQSEQSYTAVVTPSVVFHYEAVDNHFPRKITLKLSYLFSLTENHLNLVLSRDLIKLSSVVVFSLDGEQSYEQNPPQCFYHVLPESFNISGFHENGHSQYELGQLSLCEHGAEGFVHVPPSLNFPHGAEFRLEPINSQPAIENHTINSLRIALQSPHHLFIVPYSNQVKSSQNVAEEFRLNHDESRAKPLPTKLQFNFSADSVWNVHEHADMHGLREAAESFVRHQKSDKLTRHPRAAPTLEGTTNRPLMLDPVRVVHRPNQSDPFILELYLIVDETLTAAFREPYDTLLYRVHRLISEVNALFAPFNVVIVVVRLEIWKRDRVQLNVDEHHLLPTLAQFKRIHADVRHDCLHALLGIKDGGSRTRGKANSRTMCVFSRCVAYTRDAPTIDLTDTVHTMAHELGHNFGLRHDTEECNCQNCIMATGVEFGNHLMRWSPCSLRDLPVLLDYGMGLCLYDTPQLDAAPVVSGSSPRLPARFSSTPVVRTNSAALVPSVVRVYDWNFQASHISTARVLAANPTTVSSLCGNGILDPGEECDCGNRTSCPVQLQDCCDVRRCVLRAGSTCASGPCCHVDLDPTSGRFHCQLAQAGTVCRKESGDCDLPEYCDGKSQWCPMDVYKADGIGCVTEIGTQAFCVRGGCREADQWCRVLWGKTGRRAHPHCFYENHVLHQSGAPDSVANCGKIRPFAIDRWEDAKSWPGVACPSWQDAECGRLWCHHRNEKAMLLGWLESQTRFLSTVGESCSALVYDPVWPASDPTTWNVIKRRQMNVNIAGEGLRGAITQDAGMVPDGTPCSRGLCYNGSCITLTELPSRLQCRCNGLGVCNSLGNCHCNLGFHPPNCDYGGDGGSLDSGPAPSDSTSTQIPDHRYNLLPPWAPPTWFHNHSTNRGRAFVNPPSSFSSTTTTPAYPIRPHWSRHTPKVTTPTPRPKPRWRPDQTRPRQRHKWPKWPKLRTTSPRPSVTTGSPSARPDDGLEDKGLYTDPSLVIALTVLSLVVLPLVAFALYCFFCHGCKCTPLILDPVIPTKSGLRKPFDRGLRPLFRNWCRLPSFPPSFTEFITRPWRVMRDWPVDNQSPSTRG
ncbi:hypothetical protein EG68_01814 [Paragonimus skrjabini miyazakii]|uniref:Uncharacterized protein n=1 Tax=Paragonimus skrjabini miyazakii TaxID=59628 RepID=A0A8S9Z1V0_9TREM|nr:hypothetical protein EG68_01814 [Paragonimus skrjabini miyazakii]